MAVCLLALVTIGDAAMVGMNFAGSDPLAGTLNAGDFAGLAGNEVGNSIGSTFASNWNMGFNNSGSLSALVDSSGATVSGLAISWSSFNTHKIPDVTSGTNNGGTGGANPTLMKGYLDNGDSGSVSVSASGITYDSYSVVVYMDGDNGELWRRATVQLNDGIHFLSDLIEDSENVNFNSGTGENANGLFQAPVVGMNPGDWPRDPNNSEGNIVIFTGLSGSEFTLTANNETFQGDFGRAAINGIQIVEVPEPATMSLLALGGIAMLKRRKR